MNKNKYDRLVKFLTNLPSNMREKLEKLKEEGSEQAKRSDFLWFILLQSFSTMGNSRGWHGLIGTEDNYNRISYDYVISKVDKSKRLTHFDMVLRDAKVRMPTKKAEWLVSNLNRIEACGGIINVNKIAFSKKGRVEKIKFAKEFDGIGNKYARNIWMDIYDKDFYESIAIDERIKNISEALDIKLNGYEDHEKFYLDLASKINLQGWELDRLMYNFNTEILKAMNG